jgi:endonuclease III
MSRVLIYYCSIEELKSLPGVGVKVADNILEMRDARGDLEVEDLGHVPYLSRLTPQLIKCLYFASFEEELMATSIVPEVIHLDIPLGSVSP